MVSVQTKDATKYIYLWCLQQHHTQDGKCGYFISRFYNQFVIFFSTNESWDSRLSLRQAFNIIISSEYNTFQI